jgi:hypothetical protein
MLRGTGPGEILRQATGLNWARAIDAILFSHLYFGGWSSLTARSWMYHVFYAAILAAAVGLARLLRRPAILTLLLIYLAFWAGQLYNATLLYMTKGVAVSMGWYMYAVVGAQAALCVTGLRKLFPPIAARWVAMGGAALFAMLDLYTVHCLAIPYYTGMIRHRVNGSLGALHWAGFQFVGAVGAFERLTAFKSPLVPAPLLAALWLAYLLGTAALMAACMPGTWRFRKPAYGLSGGS